jgi:riboflavin kinase/FMN adenylyltransferase
MRLYRNREDLPVLDRPTAVTIGNFDGLHLGHRALVDEILKAQKEKAYLPWVVTFEPHPVQVLHPERHLKRLFDLRDSFEELQSLGVEGLFAIPFSREFSQLSPEDFFQSYLWEPLRPGLLAVGYDFSFGAHRQGDYETLKTLCQEKSVELRRIPPVIVDGAPVSSSRIRKCLEEGDVTEVKRLLRRPFYLRGVVEKGFARGRQLGFPTANLHHFGESLPGSGVYVTRSWVSGNGYWSVTNVGYNPTFKGKSEFAPVKVESHLLDFAGDLYGTEMKLEFHARVRDEKKFDSVEVLRRQIEKDVEESRQWVKKNS